MFKIIPSTSWLALTLCRISFFCCDVINWGLPPPYGMLYTEPVHSSFYCRFWQHVLLCIFHTKQIPHFFIQIRTKIMFDNETLFFGEKTHRNTFFLRKITPKKLNASKLLECVRQCFMLALLQTRPTCVVSLPNNATSKAGNILASRQAVLRTKRPQHATMC